MLSELEDSRKVTGIKQTKRAVVNGTAVRVYIAEDAEMRLRLELCELCDRHEIPVTEVESMEKLGHACGINIGASSAALLRG